MLILILIIALVVIVLGWAVLAYNSLVTKRNRNQEAWSQITVELKRRYDLIPNLVTTVKGYATHESSTFEAVTQARANAVDATQAGDPARIAASENVLTSTLKSLFAVAENYPALRAVESFLQLQEQLTATEDKLEYARRYYNTSARDYNIALQTFPRNLIANSFSFRAVAFFETDAASQAVPQVNFSATPPPPPPPSAPPKPPVTRSLYNHITPHNRPPPKRVVVFFLLWLAIGAAVGAAFGLIHPRITTPSPVLHYVVVGALGGAVFALLGIVFSLLQGKSVVLAISGAIPAPRQSYPQLYNLVEALAIGDGLPVPAIYVVEDASPNAFATGTSPSRAAITVTSGLLVIMNREELEGVLSHEMSHIKNYDTRLLLIVATLLGMAGLLASLIWRSTLFMRGGRNSSQLLLIIIVLGGLLTAVAFLFGPLVRLAISRRREELADVSGVELTRNPAGLISALRKLEQNDKPFAKFNHLTAPMCIDDPLQHHGDQVRHLFDTHPPLAQRIAILEGIASGQTT